jgi:hypothetical protein
MGRSTNSYSNHARVKSNAAYRQAQNKFLREFDDPYFCRLLTIAEIGFIMNLSYQAAWQMTKDNQELFGVKPIRIAGTTRWASIPIKRWLGMPVAFNSTI